MHDDAPELRRPPAAEVECPLLRPGAAGRRRGRARARGRAECDTPAGTRRRPCLLCHQGATAVSVSASWYYSRRAPRPLIRRSGSCFLGEGSKKRRQTKRARFSYIRVRWRKEGAEERERGMNLCYRGHGKLSSCLNASMDVSTSHTPSGKWNESRVVCTTLRAR